MDKSNLRRQIIEKAIPIIDFEGWNQRTLGKAALEAGYSATDAIRAFSGGAIDAIDYYSEMLDEQMLESLQHYMVDGVKIRKRIENAVKLRLELHHPHREAAKKMAAIYSLPFYFHRGVSTLYKTVDKIWYGIGDTSTDFNFYTKRLTLAAVYSSTFSIWVNDNSIGYQNSWDFLERRIDDVMKIEKLKYNAKEWIRKQNYFFG
ncbi:MAG: COQ9 family protein [Rickettsiales bacterium]